MSKQDSYSDCEDNGDSENSNGKRTHTGDVSNSAKKRPASPSAQTSEPVTTQSRIVLVKTLPCNSSELEIKLAVRTAFHRFGSIISSRLCAPPGMDRYFLIHFERPQYAAQAVSETKDLKILDHEVAVSISEDKEPTPLTMVSNGVLLKGFGAHTTPAAVRLECEQIGEVLRSSRPNEDDPTSIIVYMYSLSSAKDVIARFNGKEFSGGVVTAEFVPNYPSTTIFMENVPDEKSLNVAMKRISSDVETIVNPLLGHALVCFTKNGVPCAITAIEEYSETDIGEKRVAMDYSNRAVNLAFLTRLDAAGTTLPPFWENMIRPNYTKESEECFTRQRANVKGRELKRALVTLRQQLRKEQMIHRSNHEMFYLPIFDNSKQLAHIQKLVAWGEELIKNQEKGTENPILQSQWKQILQEYEKHLSPESREQEEKIRHEKMEAFQFRIKYSNLVTSKRQMDRYDWFMKLLETEEDLEEMSRRSPSVENNAIIEKKKATRLELLRQLGVARLDGTKINSTLLQEKIAESEDILKVLREKTKKQKMLEHQEVIVRSYHNLKYELQRDPDLDELQSHPNDEITRHIPPPAEIQPSSRNVLSEQVATRATFHELLEAQHLVDELLAQRTNQINDLSIANAILELAAVGLQLGVMEEDDIQIKSKLVEKQIQNRKQRLETLLRRPLCCRRTKMIQNEKHLIAKYERLLTDAWKLSSVRSSIIEHQPSSASMNVSSSVESTPSSTQRIKEISERQEQQQQGLLMWEVLQLTLTDLRQQSYTADKYKRIDEMRREISQLGTRLGITYDHSCVPDITLIQNKLEELERGLDEIAHLMGDSEDRRNMITTQKSLSVQFKALLPKVMS